MSIENPRDIAVGYVDSGLITEREMMIACLKYMSYDDVNDMMESNFFEIDSSEDCE